MIRTVLNWLFPHVHKWETTHTNKWMIPTEQRCSCGVSRSMEGNENLEWRWEYSDGTVGDWNYIFEGVRDGTRVRDGTYREWHKESR